MILKYVMTDNKNVQTGFNYKIPLEVIIALTAWTAIIFQVYLTTGSMGNLFSYFTILTNLLIAVSVTSILLLPKNSAFGFFKKPSVLSAITLYIFIVALVYNTVLRGIVTLNGWNLLVDTLLHVIVPILFIAYWFLYVAKGTLQFKQGLSWLIFPFAYVIYSLIRGAVYGWYPYPFLNVLSFGYLKVILNTVVLIVVFMLSGLAVILLDKKLGKRTGSI